MRRHVLILPFLLPLPLAAQDVTMSTAPTIQARSQIVLVDVSVTDKNGEPVRGLKPSDFILLEGQDEQKISSIEEHPSKTPQRLPALPTLPAGMFTNYVPVRQDLPLTIVLLDMVNTQMADQAYVHLQLKKYLKTLQPGAPVAIFGLTSRLIILQGFTSDPRVLLAALESKKALAKSSMMDATVEKEGDQANQDIVNEMANELANSGNSAIFSEVQAAVARFQVNEEALQLQMRTQYTLDGLNVLARYLSGFPGRKNLVWFSGGFPINIFPQGDVSTISTDTSEVIDEFHDTANLMTRSQVAIYPVDARGLFSQNTADASHAASKYIIMQTSNRIAAASGISTLPAPTQGVITLTPPNDASNGVSTDSNDFYEKTLSERSSMMLMASTTGGKAYVNQNDLATAIADATHQGANYYTIAYIPTNHKEDGHFHKITLLSNVSGSHLSYRDGYYAQSNREPRSVQTQKSAAPKSPVSSMQRTMAFGSPQLAQILFTANFAPAAGEDKAELSPALAPGNTAGPKAKPPYHLYEVVFNAEPGTITAKAEPNNTVGLALEFVALVYDSQGVLVTSATKTLKGTLPVAIYQQMQKVGVQYGLKISIPVKGQFFVRAGVHDLLNDHTGALEVAASRLPKTAASTSASLH